MMTEMPSCILSQYLRYDANSQVIKHLFSLDGFPNEILIMFHQFLITMASLKMA